MSLHIQVVFNELTNRKIDDDENVCYIQYIGLYRTLYAHFTTLNNMAFAS